MMKRDEVAGLLGVSPNTLQIMVNEKAFPPPISLGKSARTDRWPDTTVQEWVRKQQSAAYGGRDRTPPARKDTDTRQFFTAAEIGEDLHTTSRRVLTALVACGLLEDGEDEKTRYRPTPEAFARGLFWRIEKFLFRDKILYSQTVVPVRAKDEVVDIVRKALADEGGE